MSLKKELLELETTANQISRMVNAVELMAMGLDMRDDPYADGISPSAAIWSRPAKPCGSRWKTACTPCNSSPLA